MKFNIHDLQEDGCERFVLGKSGRMNLIVVGANPSTASKDEADQTMTRVSEFARIRGNDGFVMLNLYPQRATDPKGLHTARNEDLVNRNLKVIRSQLCSVRQPEIWAAWGNLIESRPYLLNCLCEIVKALEECDPVWLRCGTLTQRGHPRHPSRLAYESGFLRFDVSGYLQAKRVITK